MEVGLAKTIIQYVYMDHTSEDERVIWRKLEQAYGDKVVRGGEWGKILKLGASTVKWPEGRFREIFGAERFELIKDIDCTDYHFEYEDPDLKAKYERSVKRKARAPKNRVNPYGRPHNY